MFEPYLLSKHTEEVFRPVIIDFLTGPAFCRPDNCKQLGKLVAPASPSGWLSPNVSIVWLNFLATRYGEKNLWACVAYLSPGGHQVTSSLAAMLS